MGSIVIVTPFYAPELTGVGRYAGELARGLVERGHDVEVIAPPPHYPGWYVREPYKSARYQNEWLDGVKVWRCPIYLNTKGRGLVRLLAPISFALSSAPVTMWRILARRPDVVICVEPTLAAAPVALIAALFARARTLLHVQDLEVDAAFAVGHLRLPTLVRKAVFALERLILRRFDAIVTISHAMARKLREKGVAAETLHLVRNWVDTTKIKPQLGRNAYRSELQVPDDAFIVLYSGQMGPKQALHLVMEAASLLTAMPEFQFVIAGDGPSKEALVKSFAQLPNVHFLPLQPEERLSEFLSLADCHILPQSREVSELLLPSKVGGMLASGKRILVTADPGSELAIFLEGCAMMVAPGSPAAIVDGLMAMREQPDSSAAARLHRAGSIRIDKSLDSFEALLFPTATQA